MLALRFELKRLQSMRLSASGQPRVGRAKCDIARDHAQREVLSTSHHTPSRLH